MRGTRFVPLVTAVLLAASAALSFAAAWQRWSGYCGIGADESRDCLFRQNDQYDAVRFGPMDTVWQPVGRSPELMGLASILLAVALVLVPAALGRRTTGFTRPVLGLAALATLVVGTAILVSGLRGEPVTLPGGPFMLIYFVGLPFLIGIPLLIPDGDDCPAGRRESLVAWMLIGTTPLVQVFVAPLVAGGLSYDTTPWSEAVVVPFLLVAAVALRPWAGRPIKPSLAPQRSFSNQQRAHGLSL
jgi:hypothetical protein